MDEIKLPNRADFPNLNDYLEAVKIDINNYYKQRKFI